LHAPSVLILRDFRVAFGDHVILDGLELDVPSIGVTSVMGPGGAGKSTLLRTLAGSNDAQPSLRVEGEARYLGEPLGVVGRPQLLAQSARLAMSSVFENAVVGIPNRSKLTQAEQRKRVLAAFERLDLATLAHNIDARVIDLELGLQRSITMVRALLGGVQLVMLDEPTVGLNAVARQQFLALVRRFTAECAVLYVSHNREDVSALDGQIALLLQGRFREVAPVAQFFRAPKTKAGQVFVETGTCYFDPEASPPSASEDDTTIPTIESLPRDTVRPPTILGGLDARRAMPPRHLHWLLPGKLAGLPRPGLLVELDDDLLGLAALGVQVLMTLEEELTVPIEILQTYGLRSSWFPIADMGVPSLEQALRICEAIAELIARDQPVAVHCRAGLGRTGTVLALYLVYGGTTPLEALERVRSLQPRFVQSAEQVAFIGEFAAHLASTGHRAVGESLT
jgi:atypical dual specificity phosphatase